MEKKIQNLYNWSNTKFINSKIFFPKNEAELKKLFFQLLNKNKKFSIMGNGNTYGDSFLNPAGLTINTLNLNKIYEINLKKNFVEVGAGIHLNKLLNLLLKKKRIINNIPGSYDVTIGGCISSNVHGKDSFKFGIFGNNVISLKILDYRGKILEISERNNKFKKYVGAYGVNGLILRAKIRISKIKYNTLSVNTFKFNTLKELLNLFEKEQATSYYMGAWIDHFSKDMRGIFKSSKWSKTNLKLKKIQKEYNVTSKLIIAFLYPFFRNFFVKRLFIKFINNIFFLISKESKNSKANFRDFYYPQEKYLPKHSLLYENGKINIQILIPKKNFTKHFLKILSLCKKYKYESWWLGIKKHKKTGFLHSFCLDGYDITLQWSKQYTKNKKFKKFYQKLINYMSKNNIIIYHSKDILLNRKNFQKFKQSRIFENIFFKKKQIFNNFIIKRLG